MASAASQQPMVLSASAESAIRECFPVSSADPLDDPNFDPVAFINRNFPDENSIGRMETFVARLGAKIKRLDVETRDAIRRQMRPDVVEQRPARRVPPLQFRQKGLERRRQRLVRRGHVRPQRVPTARRRDLTPEQAVGRRHREIRVVGMPSRTRRRTIGYWVWLTNAPVSGRSSRGGVGHHAGPVRWSNRGRLSMPP